MFRVVHGLTPMNLVKKVLDPDLNANETIIVKQVLEILISTEMTQSNRHMCSKFDNATHCVFNPI